MDRKLVRAAGAALALLFATTPALADPILLDANAIGTQFTVAYDGADSNGTIAGLGATATFTLTGVEPHVVDSSWALTYFFDFSLANTSSDGVASQISSIGFNVSPALSAAGITTDIQPGYPIETTITSTRIYPIGGYGDGPVDVCFMSNPSGQSCTSDVGGIAAGNAVNGSFLLGFNDAVTPLSFEDFFIRYHAIAGAGEVTTANGTGTVTSVSPGGTQVPAPPMALLLAIGVAALGLIRRLRTEQPVAARFAAA